MSINSFGHLFRVATWGESHGDAIGATVDGCPPGIKLSEADIQPWLDRRRPGQSKYTTQRKELDEVQILSGTFEGITTGTPIQLLIKNQDHRSKDYSEISNTFRPGHADLTYHLKYGLRDYRGGGRSSARETASRVAAGGVARKILASLVPELEITGYLVRIGKMEIDRKNFSAKAIEENDFWCPDSAIVPHWEKYIKNLRKSGNSVGAMIEIVVKGVPAGLGAPLYAKMDADLASGLMSINAVKGVEIGIGMRAAEIEGIENADEIFLEEDKILFTSNNAGGVLGGITSGQDIITRFAVKPTSSILSEKKSISKEGSPTTVSTKGRHDPCVGIRAVPVGEAMVACIILDHFLLHRGQVGKTSGKIG
jgi:chorismate synthase|tara:strand:- start:187 stop:1287 length:1101 start_codon:yes stop_codon:yes gene_type:complete